MRRPLVWLAVVGLVGAACSSGDDGSTPPASTAAPATTTAANRALTDNHHCERTAGDDGSSNRRTHPTILTDGTTVTDDTIYVGVLADLSGPFSGNVIDLVDGQLAFWADKNASGGIAGEAGRSPHR